MDFYKFWQILEGKLNEWDPNEPDEGPESEYDAPSAHGDEEVEREASFSRTELSWTSVRTRSGLLS
jgi:hypothetical protein